MCYIDFEIWDSKPSFCYLRIINNNSSAVRAMIQYKAFRMVTKWALKDFVPVLSIYLGILFLTYCENFFLFYWTRKTFKLWGWRPRICKNFEITKTIYSNSETSDQFLKQDAFLTCSWRFLRYKILEIFKLKLEKKNGI